MLWEAAAIGSGGNMDGTKIVKWLGLGVAAVGLVDLLWGNTSQPVLPSALSNMLNQQVDAILIVAGTAAFIWF